MSVELTDSQGRPHSTTEPAIVNDWGVEWYKHGKRHRLGGPTIIKGNGEFIAWHVNDKLHRLDGPAFETPDFVMWYKHGTIHREDGPAVTDRGIDRWYLNGQRVTEEIVQLYSFVNNS